MDKKNVVDLLEGIVMGFGEAVSGSFAECINDSENIMT